MGPEGLAGSIGMPPLSLSQGPSTALATSDGTQTGQNSGYATSGDFTFKGVGGASPMASAANMAPLILIAGVGVAGWLLIKRLA